LLQKVLTKIKIVNKSLFTAERLDAFQIRFAALLVDGEKNAHGRLPGITFYTVNKEKIEFSIFSVTKYDSYEPDDTTFHFLSTECFS